MSKEQNNQKDDKALHIGVVIERLQKLPVYYIEAEVDQFGEDGELVVTEMNDGDWVDKHELYRLIEELRNAL